MLLSPSERLFTFNTFQSRRVIFFHLNRLSRSEMLTEIVFLIYSKEEVLLYYWD